MIIRSTIQTSPIISRCLTFLECTRKTYYKKNHCHFQVVAKRLHISFGFTKWTFRNLRACNIPLERSWKHLSNGVLHVPKFLTLQSQNEKECRFGIVFYYWCQGGWAPCPPGSAPAAPLTVSMQSATTPRELLTVSRSRWHKTAKLNTLLSKWIPIHSILQILNYHVNKLRFTKHLVAPPSKEADTIPEVLGQAGWDEKVVIVFQCCLLPAKDTSRILQMHDYWAIFALINGTTTFWRRTFLANLARTININVSLQILPGLDQDIVTITLN